MATMEQLRARADAQWELAFLIDGIDLAWVSHTNLEFFTGEGGADRTYRYGLVRKGLVRRMKTDVRTGRLIPHQMRLQIEDHVGDMATLFATDDASVDPLDRNIGPADDLSLLTQYHDKWIGHEKIGSSGERRRHPVPLGFNVGLDHYTLHEDADDSENPMTPPPMSDVAVTWKGRRCMLYRVYRDHITYADDYTQGWLAFGQWERIWWGTLRDDGTVEGRIWTLDCDGVESWTQKDLGQLYQTKEAPVEILPAYIKNTSSPDPDLDEHQSGIAIRILTINEGINGGFGGGLNGDYGNLQFAQGFQFEGDTIFELREEFATAIAQCNNDTGSSGDAWSDLPDCSLTYSPSDKTITMTSGKDVAQGIVVEICMHKKLWGLLGWDIGVLVDGLTVEEYSNGWEVWRETAWHNPAPGDGYAYIFLKSPPGKLEETNSKPPLQIVFKPDYQGGVTSLDPDAISSRGQVMLIAPLDGTSVAHYGQLRTPVASDPNDATATIVGGLAPHKSGLWLLSGPRRFANEEDEEEHYQVAEASWGDTQGLVRSGRVVLTKLLNPRAFGYDYRKLQAAWNTQPGQMKARPLICLGYKQGGDTDELHVVMQRIMLSTGTSTGWSSYSNDNPILDDGDNDTAYGIVVRDGEYADLGLGIPKEMVQHGSVWEAQALSVDSEARRGKVAIGPGENAEDVLHGIMHPVGWAWSLRNGKYGVFTPFASILEEDITVAITRAEVDRGRAEKMLIPKQSIREFAPIDRFSLQCSWGPYLERFMFPVQRNSIDRGRRYRPGGIEEKIEAPAWRGEASAGGKHADPVLERLQRKARFWERRHFVIEGLPVMPTTGRLLWPGSFIRFSHDLPVDPIDGTYGISGRRGAVIGLEEELDRDSAGFKVDILVHADRSSTAKLHGFTARGYGYDTDNDRILVRDNWLALEGDGTRLDSAFFVEPSYVGLQPFGGNARIKWFQWDGQAWEQSGTGVVTSVGTTAGSGYLEMSAGIATGSYHACKDTVVMSADYSAQDAAWVLQLYAGIGDDTGEYATNLLTAIWEDVD